MARKRPVNIEPVDQAISSVEYSTLDPARCNWTNPGSRTFVNYPTAKASAIQSIPVGNSAILSDGGVADTDSNAADSFFWKGECASPSREAHIRQQAAHKLDSSTNSEAKSRTKTPPAGGVLPESFMQDQACRPSFRRAFSGAWSAMGRSPCRLSRSNPLFSLRCHVVADRRAPAK